MRVYLFTKTGDAHVCLPVVWTPSGGWNRRNKNTVISCGDCFLYTVLLKHMRATSHATMYIYTGAHKSVMHACPNIYKPYCRTRNKTADSKSKNSPVLQATWKHCTASSIRAAQCVIRWARPDFFFFILLCVHRGKSKNKKRESVFVLRIWTSQHFDSACEHSGPKNAHSKYARPPPHAFTHK